MEKKYFFSKKSWISDSLYKWRRRENYKKNNQMKTLSEYEESIVNEIKTNGIAVLDKFIPLDIIDKICLDHEENLRNFRFNFPVFSNPKILENDDSNEQLLQISDLEGTDSEISSHGSLTYDEFIKKHYPGILKVTLDKYSYPIVQAWFNEYILRIVSGYMGCIPQMEEAYIRRSFPISTPIQNNHWHRDTNDYRKMIKVFFVLSDITQEQGPLQYLKGTHAFFDCCNGKKYYTDAEVKSSFTEFSKITSPLKLSKGTVIIADTRGLHKAGNVVSGYRDQGFAVFLNNTRYSDGNFSISERNYERLSDFQKLFLNKGNVSKVGEETVFLKSI